MAVGVTAMLLARRTELLAIQRSDWTLDFTWLSSQGPTYQVQHRMYKKKETVMPNERTTGFRFVIKPQFDDARSFAANGLAVVMVGGKYGFIARAW